MKTKAPKGLTILELLITMFLFSIVLAMVASLARSYRDVDVHMSNKTKTQQANLMLMGITTDIGGAVDIVQPTVGGGAVNEVIVERYCAPSVRLTGTSKRAAWSSSFLLRVRYFQINEKLFREVKYPDGSVETGLVGEGVSGFSALRSNDRAIELRTSFRESKLVRTTAVTAYTWGE